MALTRKHIACLGTIAALVCILAFFTFCPPTKAEEPKGQFFIPLSARYIEDLGIAGGLGYQFKGSGLILLGQISYDQFNAVNGTTAYTVGCRQYQVPFTVPAHGHRGVEVTVAIPLPSYKHKPVIDDDVEPISKRKP